MSNAEDNAIMRLVGDVSSELELVDSGGFESLFPMVTQRAESKFFECETHEAFNGAKSVVGFYLKHRFSCVVLPSTYVEGAEKQADPIAGGACPATGPQSKLLKEAAASVQFTSVKERPKKFDYEKTGAGIIKPNLEILVYSPLVDGLVVIRPYSHYHALFQKNRTVDRLLRLKNKETGKIEVPLKFLCMVSPGFKKPLAWVDSEKEDSAEAAQGFEAWLAGADDDTKEAVQKWVNCEDNPMDEKTVACLEAARAVNPPKRS